MDNKAVALELLKVGFEVTPQKFDFSKVGDANTQDKQIEAITSLYFKILEKLDKPVQ